MAEEPKKKRIFKKFTFRGIDLDQLLDISNDELCELLHARARRKMTRTGRGGGFKRKHRAFLKRLRKAKKDAPEGERPQPIKTHLRDMLVLPEMIGSMLGVHNGNQYALVEVKPEMVGFYLGEFAITYKPVTHGRPGIGSTTTSRFIPLK
mmetsp:Transcript_8301/g.10916  ORF Transcript_8301/g.10916 Transcript_8301/m.10916 type:complete len:150 (+) Transcript_8301:81-530(+)